MTREEAIAYFKDMNECTYGNVEPIQMAIKALEQEPILDKIRAEIMGMYREILKGTSEDDWILTIKWNHCLDEVLQIIDKYKAESESEEG